MDVLKIFISIFVAQVVGGLLAQKFNPGSDPDDLGGERFFFGFWVWIACMSIFHYLSEN